MVHPTWIEHATLTFGGLRSHPTELRVHKQSAGIILPNDCKFVHPNRIELAYFLLSNACFDVIIFYVKVK